jgi:hypothetical protein
MTFPATLKVWRSTGRHRQAASVWQLPLHTTVTEDTIVVRRLGHCRSDNDSPWRCAHRQCVSRASAVFRGDGRRHHRSGHNLAGLEGGPSRRRRSISVSSWRACSTRSQSLAETPTGATTSGYAKACSTALFNV